jgi:hypothetical protein
MRPGFPAWRCIYFSLIVYADAASKKYTADELRPWMRELLKTPTPIRVRPGVLRYEKSFERINKKTGEHMSLRYSTERNEDAFINLDTEPSLLSVNCSGERLTLHTDSLFSTTKYYIGRLVYGGSKWECQAENQDVSPLFTNISSVPILKKNTNTTHSALTFEVQDVSPFAFFGRS